MKFDNIHANIRNNITKSKCKTDELLRINENNLKLYNLAGLYAKFGQTEI